MGCSTETRAALHRARELVHVVPPSAIEALARQRLQMYADAADHDGVADELVAVAEAIRECVVERAYRPEKRG
jgi:hypothetical protein